MAAINTFTIQGIVSDKQDVATRSGRAFSKIVIEVGSERYPMQAEIKCWDDAYYNRVNVGDEVIAVGTLKSRLKDNGYRDTDVTAKAILVIAHRDGNYQQAHPVYQGPSAQVTTHETTPTEEDIYDTDIPF